MTVIYVFTILWLKDANTYIHNIVPMAYKDEATCLERLDKTELEYRRKEGYVIDRYSRETDTGKKIVEGFSLYDKETKSKNFFECRTTLLLD